jgi:hypothetical protein
MVKETDAWQNLTEMIVSVGSDQIQFALSGEISIVNSGNVRDVVKYLAKQFGINLKSSFTDTPGSPGSPKEEAMPISAIPWDTSVTCVGRDHFRNKNKAAIDAKYPANSPAMIALKSPEKNGWNHDQVALVWNGKGPGKNGPDPMMKYKNFKVV